jgi:hypothetical protein
MLGFYVVYDPEVSMGEFEAYPGGREGYDKPDSPTNTSNLRWQSGKENL